MVVSPSLRSSCGWPWWGLLQIQVPGPTSDHWIQNFWMGPGDLHLSTSSLPFPLRGSGTHSLLESCGEEQGPHSPALPTLCRGEGVLDVLALGSSTVLEWLELLCLGPSCRGVGFSHPEEENSPQWGTGQMNSSIRTHGASSSTTREDWAGTMFNEEKRSPSLLSGKKLWVQNDPIFGQRKS